MPRDQTMFCKHCNQAFDTKSEKNTHIKRCTEGGNFACNVEGCSSTYKSNNSLGDHMRLAHSDIEIGDLLVRSCQVCHTWFKSSYQTTTHIYQEHGNHVWHCQGSHVDPSVKCGFRGAITRKKTEDHIADKHPHHTFDEMAIQPTKRLPKAIRKKRAARRASSSRSSCSSQATTSPSPDSLSSSPPSLSTPLSDNLHEHTPVALFNALGSLWFSSISLSSPPSTQGSSPIVPSNLLHPSSSDTSSTPPSDSYYHPGPYQAPDSASISGTMGPVFYLNTLSDSMPLSTQVPPSELASMVPFDSNNFFVTMSQAPAFPMGNGQVSLDVSTLDQLSLRDIEALLQGLPLDLGFSNTTATLTTEAPSGISLEDLLLEDHESLRTFAAFS